MSTTLSTAADIAAASQTIGLLGLLVAGAICAARLHYLVVVGRDHIYESVSSGAEVGS